MQLSHIKTLAASSTILFMTEAPTARAENEAIRSNTLITSLQRESNEAAREITNTILFTVPQDQTNILQDTDIESVAQNNNPNSTELVMTSVDIDNSRISRRRSLISSEKKTGLENLKNELNFCHELQNDIRTSGNYDVENIHIVQFLEKLQQSIQSIEKDIQENHFDAIIAINRTKALEDLWQITESNIIEDKTKAIADLKEKIILSIGIVSGWIAFMLWRRRKTRKIDSNSSESEIYSNSNTTSV